jgi:hypothetical protein
MGYIGQTITTVFPTSISVDSATISGNASVGGTLGVTGVSTLSDNIVFDASSKGVHLGVTSATASNLLSDYEEGTWTPVYQGSSNPTVTYSKQVGLYVKMGDIVHIQGRIRTNATSGGSGTLRLGGLPFPNNDTLDAYSTLNVGYCNGWSADHFPTSGYITAGTDYVVLVFGLSSDYRDGIGDPVQTTDLTNGSSKNDVIFSGTYRIT